MVNQGYVTGLEGLVQQLCHLDVFNARQCIPGRVVVDDYDAYGLFLKGFAYDYPVVDYC